MQVFEILNDDGDVINTMVASEDFIKAHYDKYRTVVTQAEQPSSKDVDTERDKRINEGFIFNGVLYQSRLPSQDSSGDWDVFSGKAIEAFIAISQGSQRGDLRWSDPDKEFTWIAADNSRVPMDAFTVIELCKEASLHRSKLTFKASDIKALTPIPVDYKDDKWWV